MKFDEVWKVYFVCLVASLIVLVLGPDELIGSAFNPQINDSEDVAIHQYMVDGKEKAEDEWDAMQQELVEERVDAAQKEQIEDNERKKKEEQELAEARAEAVQEAIDNATKNLEKAKEEAAKFELVAARKAKKAKKIKKAREVSVGDGVSYSIGSAGRSEWKSWMSWTAIKSVTSLQWKLQHSRAYTGKHGIRMVDDRYCIAVGSHYCSTIGTKIDVIMENGRTIKCIMGDQKADRDTDSTNSYHVADGSYVEFIIDNGSLDYSAKRSGSCGSISEFSGKISKIVVYK